MEGQSTLPTTPTSFKEFLLNDRRHRIILRLTTVAIIIQFAIFKYLYPYASFIHDDSFFYLKAADQNLNINTYLIGYSKFLRIFSVFTKSDFALVAFQYLFIQCSGLFLVFTIFYFYKPRNVLQIAILSFMVINPLFLHLANLISSDGFFLALSLIWFSLLLWIIHQSSTKVILWHAVLLVIAFSVRYNAMIYPFIAVMAFWLSKLTLRKKLAGIGLVFVICGLFIGFTMYQYKKLTGFWQYSPFSGWQFVNNAMYAYRSVDIADRKTVPSKFQILDKMIREYFDSTRDIIKHPQEALIASTVYMWHPQLTLYKYRNQLFKNDSSASEFKKWAYMGPFYRKYGIYIIKKYPYHFAQYFIWPNAKKYYVPSIEFLEYYNSQKDSVRNIARSWFDYKSRKVTTRTNNLKVNILNHYPVLTGTMNVVFFASLICYILLNGFRNKSLFRKCMLLVTTIWLANAGFTIFASSVALRFQAFPILLVTTFALLLIDWMIKLMHANAKERSTLSSHYQDENKNSLLIEALGKH